MGLGIFGKPFRRQAIGGQTGLNAAIDLNLRAHDQMRQGGKSGDAVLEWHARAHGQDVKIGAPYTKFHATSRSRRRSAAISCARWDEKKAGSLNMAIHSPLT